MGSAVETASETNRRPHGRLVNCPGGYRAYVPFPLPPPLTWGQELTVCLSPADRAIGELAAEGRRLPNPHLLLRPFVRKEAVLSSRIEGIQTTLEELLAAEAGAAGVHGSADLREVANYVTALEYGLERLKTLPVSLRLVRELHEALMQGVRGDVATPGEFRRSQNWIGPPGCTLNEATYVPPPPADIMACLDAWERFLHNDALPPLIHAGLAHAQFEAIHPFLDGNGRVGRLLITLLLIERDVISSPLLYLSAFFETTRDEYYARLLGVTARGAWEEWLTYFLRGVALLSQDAVERIRRIDHHFSRWKQEMARGRSQLPVRALDLFAENPFWTVGGVAGRLEVAFTTAQRTLDRLEAAGIVSQVGRRRRNRIYRAEKILSVLEEPLRLAN